MLICKLQSLLTNASQVTLVKPPKNLQAIASQRTSLTLPDCALN